MPVPDACEMAPLEISTMPSVVAVKLPPILLSTMSPPPRPEPTTTEMGAAAVMLVSSAVVTVMVLPVTTAAAELAPAQSSAVGSPTGPEVTQAP